MKKLTTIKGVNVFSTDLNVASEMVTFKSGMMIDADGSPRAYHPVSSKGLDAHSSCGYPNGGWRNILAAKTKSSPPYVQNEKDNNGLTVGFFVSMTSYEHEGFEKTDTRRYVDSEKVPYIVVPPQLRSLTKGVVLGCMASATYKGKTIYCVVADIGPRNKIGEASMKAASLLGINNSPRVGGLTEALVEYKIFPGVPARINYDGTLNESSTEFELKPMK